MTASLMRRLSAVLAALFLSMALVACEEQGPAEQTGEAVDQTMEKAGDMVEEGAEKVEEGAEEVEKSAE
ncbi:MAG: hypothetical protein R3322_09595 [Kiloniellales bacterium]|jgi:hypothetical protein|nr:hypothetical protein [Kiloniellales bacterium]